MSGNCLVVSALTRVGLHHQSPGLVDCALRIVVGLDSKAILVDGAVPLSGDVEDATELDVAPYFGPLGIAVAA